MRGYFRHIGTHTHTCVHAHRGGMGRKEGGKRKRRRRKRRKKKEMKKKKKK